MKTVMYSKDLDHWIERSDIGANVLYTRQGKIVHVTSLSASDIKLNGRPGGLLTFRDYIEYTGRVEGGNVNASEVDSDLLAVCKALESNGFGVQPQVGVKGFIDIGTIRHILMGI